MGLGWAAVVRVMVAGKLMKVVAAPVSSQNPLRSPVGFGATAGQYTVIGLTKLSNSFLGLPRPARVGSRLRRRRSQTRFPPGRQTIPPPEVVLPHPRRISVLPPKYGRRTSGIVTLPSAC